MAGVALVAGAEPAVALRLGASMTALQCSIGALNDLVDADDDATTQPRKPIPAGSVSRSAATLVATAAAVVGLTLALPSGPGQLGLALAVLGIGYGYDILAKGTAWSWLPFAIGIPLLPVYGWFGAVGALPWWFVVLIPMASVAGSAIAIANARADIEGDTAAGVVTVATALGSDRAWALGAALWIVVAAAALGTLAPGSGPGAVLVPAGVAVIAVGVALGWRGSPRRRRRAWEIQAIGGGIAAVAWVAAAA